MKKGFTLVELLAVIVILAIILAIVIPGISNVINSSTKGAAESDAKMVLKALDYKMLEDNTFDPTTVNESNVSSLLGISDVNYERISVKLMNGKSYVTIVGKNKWNNMTISGTKTKTKVDDTVTSFVRGANAPVLATGMTPIKWNGSAWVDTTTSDTAWYNYDTTNKIWANARTADGSMWVWVPRFVYKINSGWHTNTAGTIDIQFTKGVDDNWNKAVIGTIDVREGAAASNATTNGNKYTNHPAFTFGDTEVTGFWMAKFEATAAEGMTNGLYDGTCLVGDNVATKTVKILPNVQTWRCIQISNAFAASRNMETNSVYGWGTSGNGIDTHLVKNTEWGAVIYLAQSPYGKNGEIWVNQSRGFITGCAGDSASAAGTDACLNAYNTSNGQQSSTTGNIYGVYGISGGTWEYTSSYVNNADPILNTYASNIVSADYKYKNLYPVATPDEMQNNYSLTLSLKGDAIYETSSTGWGASSWYGDYSITPTTNNAVFGRSSAYDDETCGGAYTFECYTGEQDEGFGFRPILLVGTGL